MEPVEPEGENPSADTMIDHLAPFRSLNTNVATIAVEQRVEIRHPWNDPSITLHVEENNHAAVEALNSLFFPSSFFGVWHTDSKDMEFIHTSIPTDKELRTREFRFIFGDKDVRCGFGPASDRLLTIARTCRFGAESETDFRNLYRYTAHLAFRERQPESLPADLPPPASFWMRNIEFNNGDMIELCKHINFYMNYFDRGSPLIIIHEEKSKASSIGIGRYPRGTFPSVIKGHQIDNDLLILATSFRSDDPLQRILHSFQVLEYAAHYYIKDDIYNEIRRLLLQPDVVDRLGTVVGEIHDVMTTKSPNDDVRFKQVIKQCLNAPALWTVIEPCLDYFSQPIKCEGGYTQEALVSKQETLDSYSSSNWSDACFNKWNALRNSIAHAREKRQAVSIWPTEANSEKLRPWADLTEFMAEHLIQFRQN